MSKRHKNQETVKQAFSTTEKVTTLEEGVDFEKVSTSTSTTTVTAGHSSTAPVVTKKEEKKENSIDILFDLF